MSLHMRGVLAVGGLLGSLLLARPSRADLPVNFQAPHSVRAPRAIFDEDFSRSVETRIKDARIGSVDELRRFSLDVAATSLHFGLGHKTTLRFGTTEREGNCIEYAHLFASVFNRAAERKHIAGRAYVVHSDARVLGRKLPIRGLDDHDWVLVAPNDPASTRLFVDPTFYDLGLDWDISRSVSGEVRTP